MKKLIIGLLIFLSTPAYAATISLGTISADATVSGFNDNFSTIANLANGNIEGSTDSGASVSNIKADSVFRINMADDADPATFAKEALSITVDTTASDGAFVYSGGIPADDTDLTSDISACVAYVNGIRVSKSATAQTYTASRDGYLDLSQTGVYTLSSVANGAAEPVVAANSARLAKVVTNGTQITSVTDLANRRLPGLLIPSHYRSGMIVSYDTATTVKVTPGTCEINSMMVSKTSDTTLTIGTAGDYAGGSSLLAANTAIYVGIDTSGNLKFHTTYPTHDNYAVSTTAGVRRYASWSSTVYRVLGYIITNPVSQIYTSGVGNVPDNGIRNYIVSQDSSFKSGTIIIPYDNTPPTFAEGNLAAGASIVTFNPSSKTRLSFTGSIADSVANDAVILSFFKNGSGVSTADYAKATQNAPTANTEQREITGEYTYFNSSIGSKADYTARLGGESAGTFYFNGISTGAKFGGVDYTTFIVEEVTG